ncbi:diacylglycerol/lipid kinase family protein [Alcanivorax quisquiliarum]|uniref:Diacylglycerol kinase family lipid kinase n=1 Tax=Alcanivorax quisquiliarum TaxID=2933565 RepID=A0ABT0E7U5_9GAMM|nr:diacylglycerol kinase family protein [Alcanivorax quisquiliarum]MCK0537908.1 diacylglycerol kinase family lipid kinase [Alcanivorax quisquiliarum]
MKILVVYNPAAGGGREALLKRLVQALERRGADVEVYRTKAPGDATRHLQARAHQGDVVVAVGGDGTTNEVLNGLDDGVPLGIFGTGTANVLARELNLPRHPEQAAEVMVNGASLTVWPGDLAGRRFMMWTGVGYDAWVVQGTDLGVKRRFGKLAYVLAMIRQLARYGTTDYRLRIDGRDYQARSAIIANGRHYGGRFVLTRQADLTQPTLQVLLFNAPGRLALLKCLMALPFGAMERVDGIVSLPAREIEIEASEQDEPLQADGDPAGILPARVTVAERAVLVRVARDSA